MDVRSTTVVRKRALLFAARVGVRRVGVPPDTTGGHRTNGWTSVPHMYVWVVVSSLELKLRIQESVR